MVAAMALLTHVRRWAAATFSYLVDMGGAVLIGERERKEERGKRRRV